MDTLLYVHQTSTGSRVNGPGNRAVVWVQGCSIGCPGCFNPETHDPSTGSGSYDPEKLGNELGRLPVAGLTVSGGEPLEQPEAVSSLIQAFRKTNDGTVLLFSGFTPERIFRSKATARAILQTDAVLAGPYAPSQDNRDIWHSKRLLLLTSRISPEELEPLRQWEIRLGGAGDVLMTGYPDEVPLLGISPYIRKEL